MSQFQQPVPKQHVIGQVLAADVSQGELDCLHGRLHCQNRFIGWWAGSKMLTSRMLALCLAVVTLSGCVSPAVRPDSGIVSAVKGIYIVPMQTPPLTVDAGFVATGSGSVLHFLPSYTVGMARTAGVLSGIAVLLELPQMSSRRLEYPQSVQNQIDPTETWYPSVELAQEAGRLLATFGRSPSISSGIQPIPGIQDSGRTVLMENWMAPIRAWYNDETPSVRYAELVGKGVDGVIEVGLGNYEIFSGKLLLQVHVKLKDPASGRLVGRARASSDTELASMDELFGADAKRFKELVVREGNQLVKTSLQELGLVPN